MYANVPKLPPSFCEQSEGHLLFFVPLLEDLQPGQVGHVQALDETPGPRRLVLPGLLGRRRLRYGLGILQSLKGEERERERKESKRLISIGLVPFS